MADDLAAPEPADPPFAVGECTTLESWLEFQRAFDRPDTPAGVWSEDARDADWVPLDNAYGNVTPPPGGPHASRAG